MSDIFISYKREDQAIAKNLANALKSEGWSVWWDPELRAGEHFDDVIEKALKEAKCVVVMWSNLSVNSEYVKAEATEALEQKKLVPLKIEDVNLPFRFKRVHTPSLLGWDGAKDASEFRKLVDDISAILGPSPKVVPVAEEQRGRETEDRVREQERQRSEGEAKRKTDEKKRRHDSRSAVIMVAVIGVVGALGGAVIINWDKIVTPKQPAKMKPESKPSDSLPSSPTQAICVPTLAAPADTAVLPQRRLDNGKVESNWMFAWRVCPEASRYHLFVIGPNALNPIINERSITSATYQHRRSHFGVMTREGWTWKVRAFVDGQWSDWSEERRFSVAAPE